MSNAACTRVRRAAVLKLIAGIVFQIGLVSCAGPSVTRAEPPRNEAAAAGAKDALYRELGGTPGLTAVVDLFLAKVDNDLRINLFFEKTDHKDLRNLVIEQLCQATGGPCTYSGRTMEEAHSGLNLTDADFAAFVDDLIAAMDELKVPKSSQEKLLALLGPMKPQVVGQ